MSYFLVLSHFFLLPLFIELNFTVSFNFQVTQSLLAYFLLFLIAFNFCFCFLMLSHFLFLVGLFLAVSFNLFYLIAFIYWTYFTASFNYSSQTLLGLFLIFPDSLFPDVSHLCHIFVTFLSRSVTLYKREGVWTAD